MFNKESYQGMLDVIKKSLWDIGTAAADEAIFEEMKAQALAGLATQILSELSLSQELHKAWKNTALNTIMQYYRYMYAQKNLPITVPYVILKGIASAQYYPNPEYRAFGDIDIMTSHDNYHTACENLIEAGYLEITNAVDQREGRHRTFSHKGIIIEIHSFYALRDKIEETKKLDGLIIENINPSHILPDLINGLTLVEHINHHMEGGLGLRQIIDWMMFVDKCLPDEKWPEFEALARTTGHTKLAIITTRMCELYLGLSKHEWSSHADPSVCKELMDYILSCGNFGKKMEHESRISERLLSSASLRAVIKMLRQQSLLDKSTIQNNTIRQKFIWITKAREYLRKGLTRDNPLKKIKEEYIIARKRRKMLNSIGIAREKKGYYIYRNGRYIRTKP